MTKVNQEVVNTVFDIVKSPAEIIAITKSSNGKMDGKTIAGIVGVTSSLGSIITTDPKLKAGLNKLGLGAAAVSLVYDINDVFFNEKTSDESLTSFLSNSLSVAGGLIALTTGGALLGSGLIIAGTAVAVWSAFEKGNDISDALTEFGETLSSFGDSLSQIDADYINNIFNNHEKYQALTTEERMTQAEMINAGGLPWDYDVNSVRRTDPFVLDLNHDGIINTSNLDDSGIFFDLDDNGMSERAA